MERKILVTGMGIITSIGKNAGETLESLLQSKSGIGRLSFIDTILKDQIPVAEVPASEQQLLELAGFNQDDGFNRNVLLGIIAAKEAWRDAGSGMRENVRTGLVSATTVGGMDKCELYFQDFLTNDSKNTYISSYDCADSTQRIADLLEIQDFITTISTACSSASNAIMLGARMIRMGLLDRVVAGGTECLTKFHLNGFESLKILDREPCKPFDARRNGITLGEGAAYLVLEAEDVLENSQCKVYAEVKGYGNSCEAFHQTASNPEGIGAYLSMKRALDIAGLCPSDIDYINAHGTGTDNNDLAEGRAIGKLFGQKIPFVSSTKPMTGHTTSAAGAVEAIIALLAMNHGFIPANLNFREPMPELSFQPVTKLMNNIEINHVMSNSFGFGGNDTTLIFSKWK